MIHLQSISLKPAAKKQSGFPFNLALVKNFDQVVFNSPLTFFVGENGSGKSTLLEAIGAGIKLATVGGDDYEDFSRRAACKLVVESLNSLLPCRGGGMADTEDLSCLK